MSLLTAGFSRYPKQWNKHIHILPHDRLLRVTLLCCLPKRVKPNHLTIFRLVLVIPILVLIAFNMYGWAVGLFIFAGLTDALDGSLARTRGEISEWGIIWDPLADKILIGAVVALVVIDLINPYLGLGLIGVEFIIILLGWRQLRRGEIQPANFWGKIKMIFEVVGLSFLLVAAWLNIDMLVSISAQTLILALVFAIMGVLVRIK